MKVLSPIEKVRQRWSPDREAVEVTMSLEPGTELDSMIRDWLHRVCEQHGPQTVVLGSGADLLPNTGTLRFEVVTFEASPGVFGRREVSIWVEDAVPNPPLIPAVMAEVYPPGRIRRRR